MLNSKDIDIKNISTLTLAFLGDGVFDLLVREFLISKSNEHVGSLNKEKVKIVNCVTQAKAADLLNDFLSEEEKEIYKRGRNTKINSKSKHGSVEEYHKATGLETLLGYLYLKKDEERLKEIFDIIIMNIDK